MEVEDFLLQMGIVDVVAKVALGTWNAFSISLCVVHALLRKRSSSLCVQVTHPYNKGVLATPNLFTLPINLTSYYILPIRPKNLQHAIAFIFVHTALVVESTGCHGVPNKKYFLQ